ncbi:CO/xanthine dehydrogenase FAD-binding subunit [Glaciihabitans tibetensis]|uniref:CO/xanthine dehydrogenase FAD-binding subunit n=1 Tax=Glaciihabitans tibetensis TaxID=1266600 RepID=A0A2T0VGB9_9MICO|nr:FAD binding domain-containing protein [Glaciihabitans tibetensis]PRY69104.1 CO/xanthine dehydrogenase FAD-binding subunit [Glaciihabitans tibetensis]
MDLIDVREIRVPTTRNEVRFAPGEIPLGGGTWLFSEPQPGVFGLVDLTALGWEPITITDDALIVSATCTIAELLRLPAQEGWVAQPLFAQCVNSLLASFKIWNVATVGGNICTSLPAGALISLAASLDATAVIWYAGPSGERRMPVSQFVLASRTNELAPGEVLRSIEFPLDHLRSRTGFRRIALNELGRTGTLVIARLDETGEVVFTITGGTTRPRQLRFDALPSATQLAAAVGSITEWFTDAHGSADWRAGQSARFAEELRIELGGTS